MAFSLRAFFATLALVAVACGADDHSPLVGEDPAAAALFDPDHIVEVEITLAPADWDTLRRQSRDFFDSLVGADCLAEPFGSPYTYVEAAVTVDGELREQVGLRKKGFFGSLSEDKPSLKIKFDEYVLNQTLFGGERMTLNNAKQDPSYINQCLGYGIFAKAGIPAPRCNFAHVTVNGVDLGLYVHVENVKKPFLRRHFEDDEGMLYEGTLSDFRSGWMGTFEQKTNKDIPGDRSDIKAVTDALASGATPASLDALVDVDQFMTFWATEVLVAHWDGYASNTNNYFVYADPRDGRFRFMPWGADNLFRHQNPFTAAEGVPPTQTSGALAHALYGTAEGRSQYTARMRELLETVWLEDEILAEVDRMETLLAPYISSQDRERGFADRLDRSRSYIAGRRASLVAALDAPFTPPPQRDVFCFVPNGSATGSFDTLFKTEEVANPFAPEYQGALSLTLMGETRVFQQMGAMGGPAEDDPTRANIVFFALRTGGMLDIFVLQIPLELIRPGTVEVNWRGSVGILMELDLNQPEATREPTVTAVAGGTVNFTDAGISDGAAIVGSFEGELYEPFL